MASYYAKLTESNEVLTVLRFDEEDEATAITGLTKLANWPLWKKADKLTKFGVYYNADRTVADDQTKVFRGTYPSIGYTYDPANDIFVEPKPYPSWTLNTSSGKYEAPLPRPSHSDDEGDITDTAVIWNEDTGAWDILE
tara:strand:- start:823 stop:1239 length:417 start_codon:yes stop_codon:yes gene_type:complete